MTVAFVALPQSVAYAAIAGLPPAAGLYSAGIASIVGALWGSSRFLSTGPTNAASILVLSVLAPLAVAGSDSFMMAAAALAVLVGLFRVAFGLAGLGVVVNFASRSVLLGFVAGASVLIAAGQLAPMLGIDMPATPRLHDIIAALAVRLPEAQPVAFAFGAGTIVVTLLAGRLSRRLPAALIALALASSVVAVVGAERLGIRVIGAIARSLPSPSRFSLELLTSGPEFAALLTGAMAIAALGLVEAMSIAKSLARASGDRIDADQEFFGQGLANLAAGAFSGYPCSGSFTRSAVNHAAGARTPLSSVYAGVLVLLAVLGAGHLAAFVPRAALAGTIVLVAWSMIDREGIARVARTSRRETWIMAGTFGATLLLPLEFAVLSGVLLSLALYVYQSSMPTVTPVVPDPTFRHFVEDERASCPQLAVVSIRGALFFGAASHVEERLLANLAANPGQFLLLLRMHGVHTCDLSGIEALEAVVGGYRKGGGDVFMVQVREPVRALMRESGFESLLGEDHFLAQEEAIEHLFGAVLDPAVCIYECEERVFAECQALPKHRYDARLPSADPGRPARPGAHLAVRELEQRLAGWGTRAVILDVRELDEFSSGHLAGATCVPLRTIIERAAALPREAPIVLVCRSGRRSVRAMHMLEDLGFDLVYNLKGGVLSWKAHGRPLAVD